MCVRAQRTHSQLYRTQTQTHNSTHTKTHTNIYTHTEPHSNTYTQAHVDRTHRSQARGQRKEGSSESKEAATARRQLARMAQRPRCHSLTLPQSDIRVAYISLTYQAALSHLSHTLCMSAKTECARAGHPLTHTHTHTHKHENTPTRTRTLIPVADRQGGS